MLGHRKVKLPLNTPEYWSKLKMIESLSNKQDTINPNFLNYSLNRINLNKLGYPIELYFTEGGIMVDYIIKQYEYKSNGVAIKAEPGDVVIDGGGCWGDTALYFANEVGNSGEVFSFEFIPNNIEIFQKNIDLNSRLKESIQLINRPLWSDSSTKVFYKDNGPASKVSLSDFNDMDGEILTLSIDELVGQKGLQKVDFIKMDIEGAEFNALTGATETIKRFRPKLAISLYHSFDDFHRIPTFIHNLVPEYRFYFSHCTINHEESVLFAKANQ
jgi:FkbM family methyltransferase